MMLLKDGESAVKAQAKGWPNGPKLVGEPLFTAYKIDQVPDDCDVMVKLRAKFAQYEEEDQQTGMSGVFCTIQARRTRVHSKPRAETMKPSYAFIGSRSHWRQGSMLPTG